MNDAVKTDPPPSRRDFFKKALAALIGAIIGLVPAAAGLTVFFDPLRRKSAGSGKVRITTLEALADDGVPQKFAVLASRIDAWNKYHEVPIGAVYLRRTKEGKVQAFNVVCPHAGCFVDYLPNRERFVCPCHDSTFAVSGNIDDPRSPAPRGLDSLETEVRNGKEIWVEFRNFQPGRPEKVPIA
jgi:menaquinol-cytochrome c reductase iron-sulfur subunit